MKIMELRRNAIVRSCLWMMLLLLFPVASSMIVMEYKAEASGIFFVQGCFMLTALVFPILFLYRDKMSLDMFGFRGVSLDSWRQVMYYIPLGLSLIPLFIDGVDLVSGTYAGTLFFFCFAVAIAEECYFRGVIYQILKRDYSILKTIVLSTILFGVAHSVCILNGSSLIMVGLQVANAMIFGMIAALLVTLTKSLVPSILYHFAFDFVNHIARVDGRYLYIAWGIQVCIMLFYIFRLSKQISSEA